MEDLKHLILVLVGIIIAFTVVMTMVAYTVLAERRVPGFIQGRLGPNRVGPQGLLQPLADLLKFILKEDIIPDKSTRFVYFLAPVIATTAALMTIVVYPFGPEIHLPFVGTIQLVVARLDIALLYVLGITSVGVYGIALAGWSSNTEYSAMKFALFFLAEYVNMFTVSMLATTLFLGGWNGPFVHQLPWLGVFYFLGKVILFLFLYIWLRGTLPRFRFDQLMAFGWKYLMPAAIFNIVLTATLQWLPVFDYVSRFLKTTAGFWG